MMSYVNTPLREPTDHACGCGKGRTCDGLECLCRPRFFAGQLLTDEDLTRLDHYIVAKNRLHNRYLHGTGVVCGLEVVCNPCDDTVTVRPGFAIGPCGEDIVVCRDTAVDVGDLIQGFRRKRAQECDPYGARPAQDCEAARQNWILAICYDEKPSRGITSLRQPEPARCGCSCGSCGGSNGAPHRGDVCSCGTTKTRATPAQCEPTLICEGYRFVLLKDEPKRRGDRDTGLGDSELGQRVQACLLQLTSRIQGLTPSSNTPAALVELCCELKEALRDIIDSGNVHDCMIGARLSEIVCPDPTDQQAGPKALAAIQQMLLILIELFKMCICSALLPPCGVDSPDDCIPLATVTVRTSDLRVLSICNWSSRRFAVTFPMLGYWLGWLPQWDTLRNAITRLCCAPVRPQFELNTDFKVKSVAAFQDRAAAMPAAGAAAPAPTPVTKATAVTQLATQYAQRSSPLSGLEATLLGGLGLVAEDDSPLASDLELQNPFAALALTRLAGPALDPIVPASITDAFAQLLRREEPQRPTDKPEAEGPAEAEVDRVTRLEASLEALQKKVTNQARTITNLRKQVGGK